MTDQRIVVITGGASGIGRATAERFVAAGDTVVLADLNEDAGHGAAEAMGGRTIFRLLDVADDGAVEAFVADVEAEVGAVGVLVNSAGLLQNRATTADFPLADHDRIWAVNYRGTYLMCRAFGARMSAHGGGAIMNIASVNSYVPLPLPAYNPTKVAVEGLTRMLAAELGPAGVRVNAVAPGYTLTPAMQARIDSGHRDPKSMEALSALGRMVMPQDVAEAIFFLCSDAAGAITGVNLPVDCGYLPAISYNSYPS
jgi:NAD(P)-dependent dehydrogenase (short-subunit alcohol dehydrogenase family)